MGIHKYGLDTSSSQLGIKSLGTQVPRADCIWNTRARKHNLRGSESKMNVIVRELICISGWHYASLRKKG